MGWNNVRRKDVCKNHIGSSKKLLKKTKKTSYTLSNKVMLTQFLYYKLSIV